MKKYKNLLNKAQKGNKKNCLEDSSVLISVESKDGDINLEFISTKNVLPELCLGVIYND